MLTSMKREINSNTIIVGDFNTPLTPTDRSTKQKISKETQTLNDTMDKLDLIDIYRTFLGKALVTHSSALAWKIPRMEEPRRLQSMGLQRVGHDRATSLSLFTFMHWRRKWQPNPVFLPGESQGRGSLVGCLLWGRTELDTTEAT